jgi:hypothetical protein
MVPPSRIGFVGMLYVMAFCGLMLGIHDLYESSKFWMHGARGYMESSDPDLAAAVKNGLYTPRADVTYVTPTGRVELAQMQLSADQARALSDGKHISVYFLTNNPEHAYFGGDHPEQPWAFLVLGVAAAFTARYALKLFMREGRGA